MTRRQMRIAVTTLLLIPALLWATALPFSSERLVYEGGGEAAPPASHPAAIGVPGPIADLLQRACADCHSSSTRWPWYASLSPANFVLASHVRRGREEFALPHWQGTGNSGRAAWMNLGASCYDVRNDVMPPRGYVLLNPASRWTTSEVEQFCSWAERLRDSLKAAVGVSVCDRDAVQVAMQGVVRRMHARNPVPGISVAVSAPDLFTGVATSVTGARSANALDSLSADDRFLAGSVGKMFFAALALRRSSERRLVLDSPVQALIPAAGIPSFAWITPRMLLTHTSGISEYDGPFMQALITEPTRARTNDDWLDVIRRRPPARSAAGSFRYSDLNYVVLAMALDALEPRGAYAGIERDILTPLGLSATIPSVTRRVDRLVHGYDGARSMFGRDAMMDGDQLIYNPQFEWGGGGFASTPGDLAQFMVAFRRGRLFPDSMWSQVAAKPRGVDPAARRWRGMGVHVDSTPLGQVFGHSGYMPGYVSWLRWYDSLQVSVAMQVNAADTLRLVDDGFDWLDSVATTTAELCRARTTPP